MWIFYSSKQLFFRYSGYCKYQESMHIIIPADTVYLLKIHEKMLSFHKPHKPSSQTTWGEGLWKNSMPSGDIWKELSLNTRKLQLDSTCMCGYWPLHSFRTSALFSLSTCCAYSPIKTTLLPVASADSYTISECSLQLPCLSYQFPSTLNHEQGHRVTRKSHLLN